VNFESQRPLSQALIWIFVANICCDFVGRDGRLAASTTGADMNDILMPGVYRGINATRYHSDPAPAPSLSNSIIGPLLNKSPRHAMLQHPRLNASYERTDNSVFDLGRAAHSLLLEGEDIASVIDADDWRTKAAKDARDEARANGLVPLLKHQHEQATAMVKAAREFVASTQHAGIFSDGHGEQAMVWEMDGIYCRALVDWLTEDRSLVIDYKTTGADCPQAWMRGHMVQHGYDTQAEFTKLGLNHLGHHGAKFLFLVQETEAPHMCYFVEPSESMAAVAVSKITRATKLWRECLSQNKWPGYQKTPYEAEAAAWSIADEEGKL